MTAGSRYIEALAEPALQKSGLGRAASGAELARLSLLTPQTMSVIVGNLERAGAVARRPHEGHGRIQIIEITDAGLVLLARCKSAAKSAETALLSGVTKTDEMVSKKRIFSMPAIYVLWPLQPEPFRAR